MPTSQKSPWRKSAPAHTGPGRWSPKWPFPANVRVPTILSESSELHLCIARGIRQFVLKESVPLRTRVRGGASRSSFVQPWPPQAWRIVSMGSMWSHGRAEIAATARHTASMATETGTSTVNSTTPIP